MDEKEYRQKLGDAQSAIMVYVWEYADAAGLQDYKAVHGRDTVHAPPIDTTTPFNLLLHNIYTAVMRFEEETGCHVLSVDIDMEKDTCIIVAGCCYGG